MKRAALLVLVACRAPASSPAAPAPRAIAASCPTLSSEAPPEVRKLASAGGEPRFVERTVGYFHESDTPHIAIDAVWRAVEVPSIAMTAHPIPGPCGEGRGSAGIAIRTLTIGAHHIGHARIVRAGITDEPTLPPGPPGPAGCRTRERLRIEDHFVDLDTGAHLRSLVQVVEVAAYGDPAPLPGVAFDAFAVDDSGVTAGDCQWFWDD